MTFYKCDRCGIIVNVKGKLTNIKECETTSDFNFSIGELCNDCMQGLKEWIKPLPQVASPKT